MTLYVLPWRAAILKRCPYKMLLRSRLPWQLDLFSSQTKTYVSEITGRIRAWKLADSCSEDLPLAIQIGQCLLLVEFNGKFAFFTVGRWTNRKTEGKTHGSDVTIIALKLTKILHFSLAKNLHFSFLSSHFPCFRSSMVTIVALKFPLSSHFPLPKKSCTFVPTLSNGASRVTGDRKPKTNDQILPSPKLFSHRKMSQIKAGPLELSFWSYSTFLHHGIQKVEGHLVWKLHKKFKGRVGQMIGMYMPFDNKQKFCCEGTGNKTQMFYLLGSW